MNFTQQAAALEKQARLVALNKESLKVGVRVEALDGEGFFAICLPKQIHTVAKINRKTFTSTEGKKIHFGQITSILEPAC